MELEKERSGAVPVARASSAVADRLPTPMEWPEAIAHLAAERTRAVTCAARAQTLTEGMASLASAYGEAKAEMDGIVAGLSVALAEGVAPTGLDDLARRMEVAITKREAFCRAVAARMPPAPTGERLTVSDVLGLGKLVNELVGAGLSIWQRVMDTDKLRRDTIRAQLEATRWPDFAGVPPAA